MLGVELLGVVVVWRVLVDAVGRRVVSGGDGGGRGRRIGRVLGVGVGHFG